jgi:hypothetical protein
MDAHASPAARPKRQAFVAAVQVRFRRPADATALER